MGRICYRGVVRRRGGALALAAKSRLSPSLGVLSGATGKFPVRGRVHSATGKFPVRGAGQCATGKFPVRGRVLPWHRKIPGEGAGPPWHRKIPGEGAGPPLAPENPGEGGSTGGSPRRVPWHRKIPVRAGPLAGPLVQKKGRVLGGCFGTGKIPVTRCYRGGVFFPW